MKLATRDHQKGHVLVAVDDEKGKDHGIRLDIRLGSDGQLYLEAYNWKSGHPVHLVSMETGEEIVTTDKPHPWFALVAE